MALPPEQNPGIGRSRLVAKIDKHVRTASRGQATPETFKGRGYTGAPLIPVPVNKRRATTGPIGRGLGTRT